MAIGLAQGPTGNLAAVSVRVSAEHTHGGGASFVLPSVVSPRDGEHGERMGGEGVERAGHVCLRACRSGPLARLYPGPESALKKSRVRAS